jgi:hypothetical protein
MKVSKAILLFLISFNLLASNWMPVSKIQENSEQGFQLEKDCIAISGEQCIDVGDKPELIKLGMFTLSDHYLKSNENVCIDSCEAEFEELICDDGSYEKIKNIDLSQVYCVKSAGKKIVIDIDSYNVKILADQEKSEQRKLKKNKLKKDTFLKILPTLTNKELKSLMDDELSDEELGL